MIDAFTYDSPPQRVVFGAGSLETIAQQVAELGAGRAFVVTGPRQREIGERVMALLGSAASGLFCEATVHTPTSVTSRAEEVLRAHPAGSIVTVGGGAAVGLGKALALRTGNVVVAIPTTYAGSEQTPIVGQTEDGAKTTVRSARALPRAVIYDVELTCSLPATISAASGMNAVAHAVEALYSRSGHPLVRLEANEALRTLLGSLPVVVEAPRDISARSDALYGAMLAGRCLAATEMAMQHRLSHLLGGMLLLPHAETHAVLLPYVVAYNSPAVGSVFAKLASDLRTDDLAGALFDFTAALGLPRSLAELGMAHDDVERAASAFVAAGGWNPRPLAADPVRAMLEAAWSGARPEPGG